MKLLIVALCLVSAPTFAQKADPTQKLESEKKQIADLEQQLQQKKADLAAKENDNSKGHVGRTWYVDPASFLSLIFHDTYKEEGLPSKTTHREGLYLAGGKNFGWFEVGPSIKFEKYHGVSRTSVFSLGVNAAYNFIENKNGNDLIPYANLKVLFEKSYDHDSTPTDEHYKTYYLGGGVKYFPLGQILSLSAFLNYRIVDGKIEGSSNYKFERNGVVLGTDVAIYF
jgi:hypothetical protein